LLFFDAPNLLHYSLVNVRFRIFILSNRLTGPQRRSRCFIVQGIERLSNQLIAKEHKTARQTAGP
jgi:hypothetical protein